MAPHLPSERREQIPRLSFLGTPVHPVMTDVPVATLSLVPLFDVASRATGSADLAVAAYWNSVVGVLAALPTAATGALDYLRVDERAPGKRTGAVHGALNGAALVTSAASLLLRHKDPRNPPAAAQLLSAATAGLVAVSAHLGGELVYEHGYRVDAPATVPQLGETSARG
jgi:uncharacterized membrane protein